jgi:hypothetical protein
VTALDERPTIAFPAIPRPRRLPEPVPRSRAEAYALHWYRNGLAHQYRLTEVADRESTGLLLPWCEEGQRWPFRHLWSDISDRTARPRSHLEICPICGHRTRLANMEARRAQT